MEYFDEAMTKLRGERFLNRPLEFVSLPVSDITRQITEKQKSAANEAAPVETEQLTAQEWFERGYVFLKAKNMDEAIRCYSEAIHFKSEFWEAYGNRGNAYFDKGDMDSAIADYNKVIQINPHDGKTYSNLARLLQDIRRYDEAEASYRKAIELNPLETIFFHCLARLLRLNFGNRLDETLPLYEKIIEINPIDFEPYLAIASISKQLGKEVPNNYVEKARQFMPDDDFYNRVCLESVCGNFDLAFEQLQNAVPKEGFDHKWAWEDPDLQWIRDDPRFVEIVGSKPEK